MYGYNDLRKDGGLLSPKVTNNIAQGKAASAATLGIGQQRIRSLKGSNRYSSPLPVTFCSPLWQEMFFGKSAGRANYELNYN